MGKIISLTRTSNVWWAITYIRLNTIARNGHPFPPAISMNKISIIEAGYCRSMGDNKIDQMIYDP